MDLRELQEQLQRTYNQYLAQKKIVEQERNKLDELDKEVTDLNTALRVCKSLKPGDFTPHHKDDQR